MAVRHDGWTGEKMAIFCDTLAATASSPKPAAGPAWAFR